MCLFYCASNKTIEIVLQISFTTYTQRDTLSNRTTQDAITHGITNDDVTRRGGGGGGRGQGIGYEIKTVLFPSQLTKTAMGNYLKAHVIKSSNTLISAIENCWLLKFVIWKPVLIDKLFP